ncbi:Smr/MutS family protein [Allomuricauda sp. d1]|uniref:Smr/MutS family protein n=1 Tax=Allomuricauda sp. d1 TaxID=3136725 RepID=UPI0031DFD979
MEFKVGDKVAVLDDVIEGIVESIKGTDITIVDQEGFPMQYDASQLVKLGKSLRVTNHEVAQVKSEKEVPRRKKNVISKKKERNAPKMEVDLHISKLTKSTRGMTNFDMLNLQLDTAKRQLEFAMRKRIQKVVFIHGVGEGVLKEELKYLFKKYDNVKFYDAEYQKYGLGATEVYIFQNL